LTSSTLQHPGLCQTALLLALPSHYYLRFRLQRRPTQTWSAAASRSVVKSPFNFKVLQIQPAPNLVHICLNGHNSWGRNCHRN
jgi:hypothetical protein